MVRHVDVRRLQAPGSGLGNLASGLISAALIVAFLYLGREILEPLVIAGLLAFILAPPIRRLRRIGLWRVPSVALVVLLAMLVIAALGSLITVQIAQLADDLPKYESNLRNKIRALSGTPFASDALERATGTLRDLQDEINRRSASQNAPAAPKPIPVEVRQPEPKGLEAIANLVQPLLSPLATSALTILFLLFLLLQREDIRDRFLRLAGTSDLQRTTAALDDAGSRLSRFFLTQTALNAGFGIVIGLGLWVIGIPNAALWGILAGLMRFVPFVGSFIAAFFPILLAAAIDPGWSIVLATAALFLVAEPVAGQVIEPVLYGHHTGLSPVAVVISTLFWTLLWGPIGLLLATPLTVCLVVLGRHIEALQFVDVLLGDEPALLPEERFYQRLLAGDATEAADQAEKQLEEQALVSFYDSVPLRALALAQADAAHGKLDREKQEEICDTVQEVIEDLDEYDMPQPRAKAEGDAADELDRIPVLSKARMPDAWQVPFPILCIGSRSPLDEAACLMLAHVLANHGLKAWVQPFADVATAKMFKVDATNAPVVCLSYFGAASKPAHVRYLIRRLKRQMPESRFLACFWLLGDDAKKAEEWRAAAGADLVATSLQDALETCVAAASGDSGVTNSAGELHMQPG